MAEQLSFDLPARPALGRDDFFVSPANALAVAMISDTRTWPDRKLALTGPQGAGKTHLAHVWAAQTGARIIAACDLTDDMAPEVAGGPVVVEDVPDIAASAACQTALFHLHNLVLSNGHCLMMTGQKPPNLWALSLPDLQSRVQAAQHVALEGPDDALLAAVLAKLFADRQVTPKPDVIPYLVAHMNRSFEAAAQVVDQLDRMSLAESHTLSRPLAIRLLGAGSPSH